MGAGGTAPAMKMSDVFILTGLTLLLGGLFMHAWVTPIDHGSEDPPYTNGASMMKGDAFVLEVNVDDQTTLRIVLMDESGDIVSAESFVLAAGESHNEVIDIETGGYYTYEIDTKGVSATISTDIDRKLMIDFLPFPFGAIFLAFGLYQRNAKESEEEILDATLEP
ncbi:MAG: hypothetical protein VW982_06780 [Candidatus Poseidoniales archaeon]